MNENETEIPVCWSGERRDVVLGKAYSPAGARGIILKELSTRHGYAERAPNLNRIEFDNEHNCYIGVWGGVTEADRAECPLSPLSACRTSPRMGSWPLSGLHPVSGLTATGDWNHEHRITTTDPRGIPRWN